MNTQKLTEEYRFSKWMQIIKDQQNSGLNIKDFCESAGIKRQRFFYWRKRLCSEVCTEVTKIQDSHDVIPSGWIQLDSKETPKIKDVLDIEINGFHISVTTETDFELLKNTCRALRSL